MLHFRLACVTTCRKPESSGTTSWLKEMPNMPTCGWNITTWKGRSLINSLFSFLICGRKQFRTSVFHLGWQNTFEVLAAALLWLPEVLQQLGKEGECLHGWNSVWFVPSVSCPLLQSPWGHPALQEGPAPSSAVHQRLPRARLRGAAHPGEDRRYLGHWQGVTEWQKVTEWQAGGD